MGGGAWPFLVGGAICLVDSDNERDSTLLTRRSIASCVEEWALFPRFILLPITPRGTSVAFSDVDRLLLRGAGWRRGSWLKVSR